MTASTQPAPEATHTQQHAQTLTVQRSVVNAVGEGEAEGELQDVRDNLMEEEMFVGPREYHVDPEEDGADPYPMQLKMEVTVTNTGGCRVVDGV